MRKKVEIEVERLNSLFSNSDEKKLEAMSGLIEQAAVERVLLNQMNEQALETGLLKINPEHPEKQRKLPISAELAKHSASYTNIMDKLMKHLESEEIEEDELGDYE